MTTMSLTLITILLIHITTSKKHYLVEVGDGLTNSSEGSDDSVDNDFELEVEVEDGLTNSSKGSDYSAVNEFEFGKFGKNVII